MTDVKLEIKSDATLEAKLKLIIRNKLLELLEDEPEDELLTYVGVMVGNKKTCKEIHAELMELIDESKSK